MYYSEEEAAQKLLAVGKNLEEMVTSGDLTAFPDGAKRMFKAADIDALAPYTSGDSAEIELAPAGDEAALSEADADADAQAGKSDTVITSEGISIFDDEDLEIESGDPMAKTAIAPSVDDEISLDGVGSGSGLLDLTRESDDTSLGEVLEHIDVEAAVPSGPPDVAGDIPDDVAAAEPVFDAPTVVEAVDASAGAFAGLVVGASLIMLLGAVAALAVIMGETPKYLLSVQENIAMWLGGGVVLTILLTVAGLLIGKAAAGRAAALQRGA